MLLSFYLTLNQAHPEVPYVRSIEELQLYSDLSAASKVRADLKRLQLGQLLDDFKSNNPETNLYRALLAMVIFITHPVRNPEVIALNA